MFVLDFRLEDVGKGQVLYGLRSSPSTTSDPCIGKSCTVTGIFPIYIHVFLIMLGLFRCPSNAGASNSLILCPEEEGEETLAF